mmetsp:Transcript_60661/g.167783  ORF Transcript_60661/g.167783 Transcript_60661/m.167783 type:complete len:245 (+) Transcript_60661:52-786(+)
MPPSTRRKRSRNRPQLPGVMRQPFVGAQSTGFGGTGIGSMRSWSSDSFLFAMIAAMRLTCTSVRATPSSPSSPSSSAASFCTADRSCSCTNPRATSDCKLSIKGWTWALLSMKKPWPELQCAHSTRLCSSSPSSSSASSSSPASSSMSAWRRPVFVVLLSSHLSIPKILRTTARSLVTIPILNCSVEISLLQVLRCSASSPSTCGILSVNMPIFDCASSTSARADAAWPLKEDTSRVASCISMI